MISKTLTGVPFFDERYGGTYRGRAMLVCGRADSGKSLFGIQFIAQGIRQGERCLLLSGRPAADVAIYADAFGLTFSEAVENGTAIVLEYSDYVPGRDGEMNMVLPPEGFVQLQEIIQSNAVKRVVLDTCLPWISLPSSDSLSRHVLSFVRAFDRLGVTTVLTLPKPISPIAFKLKSLLEDIVPVAVTLMWDESNNRRTWIVNKYLGEQRLDSGTDFRITRGIGLAKAEAHNSPPPGTPAPSPPAPAPAIPAAQRPETGSRQNANRIRFADVMMGTPDGMAANKAKKTHFSRIINDKQ